MQARYAGVMNKPANFLASDSGYAARFTSGEFIEMLKTGAFKDMRIELVRGELRRMSPALSEHGRVMALISHQLLSVLEGSRAAVYADTFVQLGPDTLRAPDVAIACRRIDGSRPLAASELSLVVEVSNETIGQDLGEKAIDYAAAGIPAYWVVDVNAHAVHVMTNPVEGEYRNRNVIRFGEPLAVPGSGKTITLD